MKDYYEILEVNPKASKEIIDKAFKLLAKKYHPDTKKENDKQWAEEKFKEINEAYEILSNDDARKQYDTEYVNEKDDMLKAVCLENERLNNLVKKLQSELELSKATNNTTSTPQSSYSVNTDFQSPPKQTYTQYYNSVNNSEPTQYEYKQYSYKKTPADRLKDIIAFLMTILAIIGLGFVIWKIPITNKLLVDLYENNAPIRAVVNIILKIFGV